MSEPTGTMTSLGLVNAIGAVKFKDAAPTGAASVECLRILNLAVAQFLGERKWGFMNPAATITLWPTATGTASGKPVKDNGTSTVTSAAAMFYPSMVGHSVAFTAGSSYTITAYTSSTVVIVSGDASGEADADTMTVTADGDYSLPADYGGWSEAPAYADTIAHAALKNTSPAWIRAKRSQSAAGAYAAYFAAQARAFDSAVGQRFEFACWPTPSAVATLTYRYRVNHTALTASATEYPPGGSLHAPTLLSCALMLNERDTGNVRGPYWMSYYGNPAVRASGDLQRSIRLDAAEAPRTVGMNTDKGLPPAGRRDPNIYGALRIDGVDL